MHKYIHEYDNEWGYFVKLDEDIDEENYIIIDEYEYTDEEYKYTDEYNYKYAVTDEEYKYEDEEYEYKEYKYKNKNKDNEDKKLIQYNKHDNINKSLFIYFVVTILIYISYTFSVTYKNYAL